MSEDRTLETEATGDETEEAGVSRRGALECDLGRHRRAVDFVWRRAEILGPSRRRPLGNALAAETPAFTFLQISDSHIGLRQERP